MKPKQFFYILTGLMIAIAGLGGYAYFKYFQKIQAQTKKLGFILADKQVASDKAALLKQLEKQYGETVLPLLPNAQTALPKTKSQSELARQLKALADSTGVSLSGLTFKASSQPSATSQTDSEEGLLAMPVNFDVGGSYAQVYDFIQRLEYFSREANIKSVGLSAGSAGVTAQLDVIVYLKP